MNRYQIIYFTSGGYKATGYLETNLIITRDSSNALGLYDANTKVGSVQDIEILFLEQQGYKEEITVFEAQLLSSSTS